MCTLVIIRNVFPGYPLVVAANRDERLDRPALPPGIVWRDPVVYAPLDLEGQGTWIGVSERGVFAGVTNRRDVPYLEDRRTRGALAPNALIAPDARTAARRIGQVDPKLFNGFQLVIADRREGYVIRGDGKELKCHPLADRVTVLTDRGMGNDHCPRAAEIMSRIRLRDRHRGTTPRELDRVLCLHDFKDADASSCVHGRGYGTRSSTVVRLDDAANAFDVWHREGAACSGNFDRPFRLPIIR